MTLFHVNEQNVFIWVVQTAA